MATPQTQRGFSLIEVLISIFIFGIIMTAASVVFGRSVESYRHARASQQILEDAQFAMNRIAKSLRTSSVIQLGAGGRSIIIYDYSRDGGACVRYRFTGGVITEEVEPLNYNTDDILRCGPGIFTSSTTRADLTTLPVTGQFAAQSSTYQTRVGKVSMVFVMTDVTGAPVRLQTTVSLRDYDVSGLL